MSHIFTILFFLFATSFAGASKTPWKGVATQTGKDFSTLSVVRLQNQIRFSACVADQPCRTLMNIPIRQFPNVAADIRISLKQDPPTLRDEALQFFGEKVAPGLVTLGLVSAAVTSTGLSQTMSSRRAFICGTAVFLTGATLPSLLPEIITLAEPERVLEQAYLLQEGEQLMYKAFGYVDFWQWTADRLSQTI